MPMDNGDDKVGYSPISSEEEQEASQSNHSTILARSKRSWRVFRVSCNAIVFALAIWGTYCAARSTFSSLRTPETPSERSCSCGTSSASALALGCQFDGIATAFLPPHCIDQPLLSSFDKHGENFDGSWNYWADPHKQVRLNASGLARIAGTDEPYYTTHKWHVVHCVYSWMKLARQQKTGVVVEKAFSTMHHIKHCGKMMAKNAPLEDIATKAWVLLDADIIRGAEALRGGDPLAIEEDEEDY